ncbi:M48 family metallopeptidase [Rhodobacter ferrooxidans]|uniref:YgjP-like metallopeptidase domain-containing protein n=1 Tax=Rhodobacter ferrooxidans TaxID=371731 RepID=C8S3D6_9RHOB|nr:SprT family zinc-dependent metalloprotease [Rhodobacter sp. SW2]EEW24501.1 protein of unknown function DUF45 [Rhodobacter sp. SW2]
MAILPGSPAVEITLRRSARARRFSLRVSRLDGRVTLSLPLRAREADALAFVNEQAGWIRQTLAEMAVAPGQVAGFGSSLPYLGQALVLTPGSGRAVRVDGAELLVPGQAEQVGARVAAFLKVQARDRLAEASDRHAASLGLRYSSLTLRDTRSRWGSCTAAGGLMYSWRLIMAPPQVLDYVAAHEVAHLAEMNHSPAFWEVVTRLHPGYSIPRRWLKTHGAALHGLRFAP